MRVRFRRFRKVSVVAFVLLMLLSNATVYADDSPETVTYLVTIQNLTGGQPLSPPVAATHRRGIRMFRVGTLASAGIEAIAEDGNQGPMFDRFNSSNKVTQAVDVGMPLTPSGQTVANFTDAVTFAISARAGDRFSFAAMLICTNDGFVGLDSVRLPRKGSRIYLAKGYDAGTEQNTEKSADIVDPCSALGPVPLAGDPNGNEDAAVDSMPHQRIRRHPGIMGNGDLSPSQHGWIGPVAKVTITRTDEHANQFKAVLTSIGEVPPVLSGALGKAKVKLEDGDQAKFRLQVHGIYGVVQAHIHYGLPSENGPVVAFLYGPSNPSGPMNGTLAEGVITQADLVGPFAGDFAAFAKALRSGRLYVNVHTAANPSGEIRGQLGAK